MRPTWAEIRLDHIADNYRTIKTLVGDGIEVMAVVKANAYGHGAVPVAARLEKQSADWFGVALVEEGLALRRAGIRTPILCLGGFWMEDQALECIENSLTPAIYRADMLDSLQAAALSTGKNSVKCHLKIDTGMGRLGALPEQLPEILDRARACPNLLLDGVMTHFASADAPLISQFTQDQIDRFYECLKLVRERGHNPSYEHLSNSAGTHAWPKACGNLVRAGGLLYGFHGDILSPALPHPDLKPALSLKTRIIMLKRVKAGARLGYGGTFEAARDSLIAVVPIGYDDGLRRAHSNNGRVLIREQFAPIAGRVSMDLTIIDVTDVEGAALGDEAILIGDSGDKRITAEEVAALIGTISFEVSCGISDRVPRVYLDGERRTTNTERRWSALP